MSERNSTSSPATGLAGLGFAALAFIACCAGPAAILGVVGGITLGAAIGGLAGLAVIAAGIAAFVLIRRRRSCEPTGGGERPEIAAVPAAHTETDRRTP